MSLFNKFFTGEAQDRKNEFEDWALLPSRGKNSQQTAKID
jgi:hypothetical protein